jgi:hypothetical protein
MALKGQSHQIFFFLYIFFGEPAVHFSQFFPLLPLTEVSPRPSAIPGGNPPGDGQSAMGWGDAGLEPGTAGQQSGALPLSHHASQTIEPPCHLLIRYLYPFLTSFDRPKSEKVQMMVLKIFRGFNASTLTINPLARLF